MRAITDLDFLSSILIKGTKHRFALLAIELDILQLREDASPTSDHSRHANEIVKMGAAKITKSQAEWEIRNSYMNFSVYTRISRVVDENCGQRDFIKDFKHCSGRISQEISQDWLRECKVGVRNLKRFRVV